MSWIVTVAKFYTNVPPPSILHHDDSDVPDGIA